MTKYFSPTFLSLYDDALVSSNLLPRDAVIISDSVYAALKNAISQGLVLQADMNNQPVAVAPAPPAAAPLTLKQYIAQYSNALDTALNDVAISWQYESMTSAATYLNSSVRQFAIEAAVLVNFRDTAWNNAQTLLARIEAGKSQVPATTKDFLSIVLPSTPVRPVA